MLGKSYDIKQIAEITDSEFSDYCFGDKIADVLIDSRKLRMPKVTLFVAIETERDDGHRYIEELINKGVRNFIVEKDQIILKGKANFLKVSNSIDALQKFAAFHRGSFEIPVVGVTGSNGKTIVKEWAYQLLQYTRNVIRSPKSYNSQLGVPISALQLSENHNVAVFEAGISTINEMKFLQSVIKPTIGIFTNIGDAHSQGFKSKLEKISEKSKLFEGCKSIVYCKDHQEIDELLRKRFPASSLFTWSFKKEANIQISKLERIRGNAICKAIFNNESVDLIIPFSDKASVENIMHCFALMCVMGENLHDTAKHIEKLTSVAMRLELKEGVNNCTIINDAYNSDINSLSIAIDFLLQQNQHQRKTIVLSDFLQVSENKGVFYRKVASLIAEKKIDRLIGIGSDLSKYRDFFQIDSAFYETTPMFLKDLSLRTFKNETVLLKGARKYKFEDIDNLLQKKAHQTVLEINLSSLINNYNYFKSKIGQGTKVMAMVKAFSYGTGSYEIANVLQYHNLDYLAVAYADEGIELRNAGIKLPVMVMNPEESSFSSMLNHNLEPEIYSLTMLKLVVRSAIENGFTNETPANIHLKIDTGMHRLGFVKSEIEEMLEIISSSKCLYVKSVFSHMAASDIPAEDTFTKEQINRFEKIGSQIDENLGYKPIKHMANSAAINRFPEARFDMVRLGISLYGIATNMVDKPMLQNVCSLKSVISQIKHISKGETIGYSRKGFATKDTKVATVAIGYADGLNRLLSNGLGTLYVNSKPAPIIGNVCMDMCMIDVTNIDAQENDEVVIFSSSEMIEDLARKINTIPYEILTNVSRRVKRVYMQE